MLPGKEPQPQIKKPNCNAGGVATRSCVIASEKEDSGHSCCDLLSTFFKTQLPSKVLITHSLHMGVTKTTLLHR